jgi:hypothetical protein
VTDPAIHQVINMGQMVVKEDEYGRSWIAAPLNAGADTLGAIHTYYRDPAYKIRARQQQLFTVFADRTATALERIDTNKRLQERAQQLEIMNQVTFSLAATKELDPLLELILDKAIELLDTEAGTFMISREENGELEFRVARGPSSSELGGAAFAVGGRAWQERPLKPAAPSSPTGCRKTSAGFRPSMLGPTLARSPSSPCRWCGKPRCWVCCR